MQPSTSVRVERRQVSDDERAALASVYQYLLERRTRRMNTDSNKAKPSADN